MDGQVVVSSKYGIQVLVHNKRPQKKSDTRSNIFLWRKPVTNEKHKIFCEIWRTSAMNGITAFRDLASIDQGYSRPYRMHFKMLLLHYDLAYLRSKKR
jgi:hypothetical protein